MMRRAMTVLGLVTVTLLVGISVATAGDDAPWFDWGCGMCKNIYDQEGLIGHMGWEHHIITNGMMSVTTVEDGYKDAYMKAALGMDATVKRMMSGEEVKLCGMCTEMGRVIAAGATMDRAETSAGYVMLVTAQDETLVAEIKAMAQRTIGEMAKIEDSGHAGEDPGHEGHDHGGH